jgi:DNA-binding transcriptional MerR regulator
LRTQGGQRRYTPENIFIITKIKRLREQGKSLREIKWSLRRMNRRKKQDLDPHRIDFLADRIAEVVRAELYNFFTMENKEIGRS